MPKTKHDKMAHQIMLALFLGLGVGLAVHYFEWQEYTLYLKPISDIFLRLLKMAIVPLVLSSIYMAVVGLGSPERLGDMGGKSVGYYLITTAIAVAIGITLVNIFQPGVGADLSSSGLMPESVSTLLTEERGLFETILGVIVKAIPENPFEAMAEMLILQVIAFAAMMGVVALHLKSKAEPMTKLMSSLEEMALALTMGIMKLAPLGVGILMMNTVAGSGFDAIKSLGQYMLVVLLGLFAHACFLLILGSIRAKRSPIFIIRGVAPALMTAFSTCTSTATLPLTMANVEENLRVRKKTAEFILPLGAIINMDGTALYESVAVIFIAQAYGIHLSPGDQVIVFLTCTLAAVGTATIPGAGLVTMSIVLKAVGLPLDGIGLILAVDRILDQFRTTLNVLGDCVGAVVVDSITKDET